MSHYKTWMISLFALMLLGVSLGMSITNTLHSRNIVYENFYNFFGLGLGILVLFMYSKQIKDLEVRLRMGG